MATPPVIVPLPKTVDESRKFTEPVIVPEVAELTVAVNVTEVPTEDGLREEVTAAVVEAVPTLKTTTVAVLVA